MKKGTWVFIGICFVVAPAHSHLISNPQEAVPQLGEALGRPVTKPELQQLQSQFDQARDDIRFTRRRRYLLRAPSAMLFCVTADADYWASASIAGCVDLRGNSYYLISGGVGLTVGLSVGSFVLLYFSSTNQDVTGTFVGPQVGFAIGRVGFNGGAYLRESEVRNLLKREVPLDRMYLMGYVAGASLDISTAIIYIGRL